MIDIDASHNKPKWKIVGVWLLIVGVVASIIGVLAFYEFYPDNRIAKILWDGVWLVLLPVAIVGCLILINRKKQEDIK